MLFYSFVIGRFFFARRMQLLLASAMHSVVRLFPVGAVIRGVARTLLQSARKLHFVFIKVAQESKNLC